MDNFTGRSLFFLPRNFCGHKDMQHRNGGKEIEELIDVVMDV